MTFHLPRGKAFHYLEDQNFIGPRPYWWECGGVDGFHRVIHMSVVHVGAVKAMLAATW